jgi:metal-responsive CopG/Arc/MetJ family transcriptional regulator
MPVTRLAISLDDQLAEEVARAAEQQTQGNVSAWLAEAARQRLRQLAAEKLLAEYEARAGVITDDELAGVEREWPPG